MFSKILDCPGCKARFHYAHDGKSFSGDITCPECGLSAPCEKFDAVVMCQSCHIKIKIPLRLLYNPSNCCPVCHAPVNAGGVDDDTCGDTAAEGNRRKNWDPLLKNGDLFDKYRIVRLLGRGGMAEVYLAEHLLLKQYCALKLMLPGPSQSNPVFVKRFVREAKLSHRFNHPNIVKVFDAGSDFKTGHLFLAMEYVEGFTLQDLAYRKKLSEEELLEVMRSITAALSALADAKVVHRDIKPSNIMYTKEGEYKVMDLGIAKSETNYQAGEKTLTMEQSSIGTPGYASPEQCRSGHNADIRSDIYCLGATIYHAASGVLPFDGNTPVEIILKVMQQVPVPLKSYRPDLSERFLDLIDRMMRKNPDERPQTPAALAEEVEKLRNYNSSFCGRFFYEPLLKAASAVGFRHGSWLKKAAAGGAVLLALLLAGTIAYDLVSGGGVRRNILPGNRSVVVVDPAKAVIVVPPNAMGTVQYAGAELQRHLRAVTGVEIPIVRRHDGGRYPFIMGTPYDAPELALGEARWKVTPSYTCIYGESTPVELLRDIRHLLSFESRSGDLSALYGFLEQQLKVAFLAPGAAGRLYAKSGKLSLKIGEKSWKPALMFRSIKPGCSDGGISGSVALPEDDFPFRYMSRRKKREFFTWLKQHRMGSEEMLHYESRWNELREKYAASDPGFFAQVNGKRAAADEKYNGPVQLCVSSNALRRKIIELWEENKLEQPVINLVIPEGGGHCECSGCRAWDGAPRNGKKWDEDLSDRYIRFANLLLQEARQNDPGVRACFFASSSCSLPPRQVKVDPALYIGFEYRIDRTANENFYDSWRSSGAQKFYFRSRELQLALSLPAGNEKQIFDNLKLGISKGAVGCSYASPTGTWELSGTAAWMIARAQREPEKSFDELMNEYYALFGPAANDVKQYYEFFRDNVWGGALYPLGRGVSTGELQAEVPERADQIYKESDFTYADQLLFAAQQKAADPAVRKLLENMSLANRHCLLTHRAMIAKGEAKTAAAQELFKFRKENFEKINVDWQRLFADEIRFGDCTGVGKLLKVKGK